MAASPEKPKAERTPRAGGAGKPAPRAANTDTTAVPDWREAALARVRALILEADPEMTEEQ